MFELKIFSTQHLFCQHYQHLVEYSVPNIYCVLLYHKNKPPLRKRHHNLWRHHNNKKVPRHDCVGGKEIFAMNMMQLTYIQYPKSCFKLANHTKMFLFQGFSMRLCHYGFQKIHNLLTLLCIYLNIFVIFTFPYSLLIICNLIWNNFNISGLWKSVTSKSCVIPGSH